MSAVTLALLQRLADEAAAEEAEVIAGLQPIADLVQALLAVYASRGVPRDHAKHLTLAVVPLVIEVGDRS